MCYKKKFPEDILCHSYSVSHLVIHFANWLVTTLREIILRELNLEECLSAVLSYRKNIEEKSSIQLKKFGENGFFRGN